MIKNLKDNMLLVMAEEINEILVDVEDKEIIKMEINDLFGVYNILSKNNFLKPISDMKIQKVIINQDNFIKILFELQKDLFKSLRFGLNNTYIEGKGSNQDKIEYIIGQLYGYLTHYIDDIMIKKKEVKVMKFYNFTLELND